MVPWQQKMGLARWMAITGRIRRRLSVYDVLCWLSRVIQRNCYLLRFVWNGQRSADTSVCDAWFLEVKFGILLSENLWETRNATRVIPLRAVLLIGQFVGKEEEGFGKWFQHNFVWHVTWKTQSNKIQFFLQLFHPQPLLQLQRQHPTTPTRHLHAPNRHPFQQNSTRKPTFA